MKLQLALTGLALGIATMTTATTFTSPAQAADPVCVPGFSTVKKESWLLKCRKTVPLVQKGVALTEAGNAHCTTDSYWNSGPKVTAQQDRRQMVQVTYICGHVES